MATMWRIFFAGPYCTIDMPRRVDSIKTVFESYGFELRARWLTSEHSCTAEEQTRRNVQDIVESDGIIAFWNKDLSHSGGTCVEIGMGMLLRIPTAVFGDDFWYKYARNIVHHTNLVVSHENDFLQGLHNACYHLRQHLADKTHTVFDSVRNLLATMLRKQHDYATDEDPLDNVRASRTIGVPPWVGAYIRLLDKTHRIKNFIVKGKLLNEGIEDAWLDVAGYGIIGHALYCEGKGTGEGV